MEHLVGYLRSWSALVLYERETGADALAAIRGQLESAWGDPASAKDVKWPLTILAGR